MEYIIALIYSKMEHCGTLICIFANLRRDKYALLMRILTLAAADVQKAERGSTAS